MSAAAISDKTPLRDRGKLLRKFRKQYRITLTKFGEYAGLSQPMLSQFERGDHDLSDEAWVRVKATIQKLLAEDDARRKQEWGKAGQTATRLGALDEAKRKKDVESATSTTVTEVWGRILRWVSLLEAKQYTDVDGTPLSAAELSKESLQLLEESIRSQIHQHINQLVTQRNYWQELAQSQAQVISVQRKQVLGLKTRLAKLEQKLARRERATKASGGSHE